MSIHFHKPKVYRSTTGCCICKAKSSSSRFTDSKKYEDDFINCFKLEEKRQGEICNACVLLIKRWKKLPPDCDRNWHHIIDSRSGPGIKSITKLRAKNKKKQLTKDTNYEKIVKKKHVYLKREREQSPQESDEANDEDNTSKSSSRPATPDDCDDIVIKKRFKCPKRRNIDEDISTSIDFIDLNIYKKTKICCGIIFKGPFNEIIIDQSLFKTCSNCLLRQKNKQQLINKQNSFHSSSVSPVHSVDSTTNELIKQTGKIFSDSSSDSGYDESSNQGIVGRKNIKISNSNNSNNNSCITTTTTTTTTTPKKLTTNILLQPVKKIQSKTKTTITETVRLQNDILIKSIPIKPVEKLTCKSLVSSTSKQNNSLVDFAIHTSRQSVTN